MLGYIHACIRNWNVCFRTIPDPGSQKLNWHKPPLTVLVIKKMHDENALSAFTQLVKWLIQVKRIKVIEKHSGWVVSNIHVPPLKWKFINIPGRWFKLLSHKGLHYTPANEGLRWGHFRITQCFSFCLSVCWQVLSTHQLGNFCMVNG